MFVIKNLPSSIVHLTVDRVLKKTPICHDSWLLCVGVLFCAEFLIFLGLLLPVSFNNIQFISLCCPSLLVLSYDNS